MVKPVQEEFFSPEQFTRICSRCRRELPRTRSFFPEGRSNDGMSSVCRQCTQFKLPQSRKPSTEDFQHQERNVKPCSDCGLIKPLNEFFMDSQTVDGKARSCKGCSDQRFQAAQQRRERFGTEAWAVFFIQDSRNLRVKIGNSIDPYQSFDALQQASSVDLRLLAVLEGGTQSQAEARERELHRQFNSYHEGNGWFECVAVLQQYITLIQQQTDEKSQTGFKTPPMRTQPRRKRSHPQAVRVEGQLFPSFSAASAATGYTTEQLEQLGANPNFRAEPAVKEQD